MGEDKLLIYLDNCCFNRPYDSQKQLRIRLETQAKIAIQEMIRNLECRLSWSFMLDFENSQNINSLKADEILKWAELASDYNIGDEETLIIGSHLEKIGLRQADAMHVALAIQSRCDYFITTDDGILKRAPYIDRIFIINPVDFILKQEKNHEE